jgi:Txe/YoeB family toxin of toxin-antitoxin system
VKYKIVFTKQAVRDAEKIKNAGYKGKVIQLLNIIRENLFEQPYEKLLGDLSGYYSRRINIQHRLVYMVLEEEKMVKVIRMWTHYD